MEEPILAKERTKQQQPTDLKDDLSDGGNNLELH